MKKEIKLAIIGSRDFDNYNIVKHLLLFIYSHSPYKISEIVSGGAKGVDTLAEKYANENDIPIKIFLPEWDNISNPNAVIKVNSYGKKYDATAGFKRNRLIIERADFVIAIWNGRSRGTKNSISIATELNKKLYIYNYEEDKLYNPTSGKEMINFIKNLKKEL